MMIVHFVLRNWSFQSFRYGGSLIMIRGILYRCLVVGILRGASIVKSLIEVIAVFVL